MDIDIYWLKPITLIDGTSLKRIYTPVDESSIHDIPGIYIFARNYGERIIPLYIGLATNIANRVFQQLIKQRVTVPINTPKAHTCLDSEGHCS